MKTAQQQLAYHNHKYHSPYGAVLRAVSVLMALPVIFVLLLLGPLGWLVLAVWFVLWLVRRASMRSKTSRLMKMAELELLHAQGDTP